MVRAESINTPISTKELERRWAAVRAAMKANGIDALIMQNNNDHMGGYVKYFTDVPAANGYPLTVVFPRDDRMSVLRQGLTGICPLPPEGDGLYRGVKQVMMSSPFSSAYYTHIYDADYAAKALAPYARGTIGLVGLSTLPISIVDHLRSQMPQAKFVSASDMVDRIMVIKSEEEIALIRRTAAAQDLALKKAFDGIKPGMREHDVSAIAEHAIHNCGGEQGLYLTSAQPADVKPGEAVNQFNRHLQNRVLRKGDIFTLLVETNGPGGMYTELHRTCVLGKAPQDLKDEFAVLLEARQLTLKLLKPGASCPEIWNAHNRFMREHGLPEETRVYAHGQGYDLVERPLIRFDEPMLIQENMNITVHPNMVSSKYFNSPTDNYIIGPNGPTERIHKFPEIVVELDV